MDYSEGPFRLVVTFITKGYADIVIAARYNFCLACH